MKRNPTNLVNRRAKTTDNLRRKGLLSSQGMINGSGLVKGRGHSRGRAISRERGHISTNGLVNGNGLINGNGLVNGNGLPRGLKLRKNRMGLVMEKDMRIGLSILILFILIVPPISLLLNGLMAPEPGPKEIIIDGGFSDWASIPKYTEALLAPPDNINIRDHTLDLSDGLLSFYIKVKGNFFPYQDPDLFEIFIDADGNRNTGYKSANDFGSDYMVELYGWNGSLMSSSLLKFSGYDRYNFSAWSVIGTAKSTINLNELEAQIDTSMFDNFSADDFMVMIYGKDSDGREVYCHATASNRFGSLLVQQNPIAQSIIFGTGDVTQLSFTAKGTDVNVTSVTISTNAGTIQNIEPFPVPVGITVVKTVRMNVSSLSDETLVIVNLESVIADRPVRIIGREARLYVRTPPSGHIVDGWFGEWGATMMPDGDISALNNMNIDISQYSTSKNSTNAFFYLYVKGEMLGGTSVPTSVQKPPPGIGGPGDGGPSGTYYVPRKSGEDKTIIYIDSDSSDVRGLFVAGIFADYKIEIKGIYGKITSRTFYNWTQGSWNPIPTANVEAEIDDSQLESAIPLIYLGTRYEPKVVFVTTDWSALSDSTMKHEGLKSMDQGSSSDDYFIIEITGCSGLNADQREGTKAPPSWPGSWFPTGITDDDDSLTDGSLDILELYWNEDTDYLYIRIRLDTSSAPTLSENTWWVDIDLDGDCLSDWRIEERTGNVTYYQWSVSNTQWEWNDDDQGSGGSNVQSTTMTIGASTYGVVDFAINKTIVSGLGSDDKIIAATHMNDNIDFDGNTTRNPSVPSDEGDVTTCMTIPEFHIILVPFIGTVAIPIIFWRIRKKKD